MKIIDSSVEILDQKPGELGVYQMIELAGRTAYKSEDKITETSAEEFVKRMKNLGHGSPLEHGTVYLTIPKTDFNRIVDEHDFNFFDCPFIYWGETKLDDKNVYITTDYRTLYRLHYEDLLPFITEPTDRHVKRITVKFICDRGVSHEFVRHRSFSFLQESTRYCNYSKDKFGKEITFIRPQKELDDETRPVFEFGLRVAEQTYFDLLDYGWKPEQARAILPNALKTELIMTGTTPQWVEFFKLRTAVNAHPDARKLATDLLAQFIDRGYIKQEELLSNNQDKKEDIWLKI